MDVSKAAEEGAGEYWAVGRARTMVRQHLLAAGLTELADDAVLVVSELVTNAILHGGGCTGITVAPLLGGIRIEVADQRPVPPVMGLASTDAMTGRGLRLVARLSARWGVETRAAGKVVWAELSGSPMDTREVRQPEVLSVFADDLGATPTTPQYRVVLGDVPTDLLLAAKSHVDNLVREFTLVASGARSGVSSGLVPHLGSLIEVIAHRFAAARDSIKRQALAAAAAGLPYTRLELHLDADTADAGQEYLDALDAIDAYCRAGRLLTLETPPTHRVFRRWYVEELISQVAALAAGEVPGPPQSFLDRLLREVDRVAAAQEVAERSARLYAVAGALAGAATTEAVAAAVLTEGVAALGASGGGLLLTSDAEGLLVPGTVGYDEEVVARLRAESKYADLPAAVALRTGEAVWIESRAERDSRFPQLVYLEPTTVSVCAVPLAVPGRVLGAIRFSFSEPRLFGEDERRFVSALAAQSAQALDRAQLQASRIDVSSRLQKSLLPPSLPDIPGVEVAAVYHPLGDGIEVGGDFYDIWPITEGTFAFAVGDVVGTGPEAAAVATLVRYSLRALTLRDADVPDTLHQLNEVLLSASGDASELFSTAVFGTLSVEGGRIRVLLGSGGHPFPLVCRAAGEIEEVALGGTLLGIFPKIDVAVREVELQAGDLLVLFTDGLFEARAPDGAFMGMSRVRAVLGAYHETSAGVTTRLEQAVLDHVEGELEDDLAVVVLRAR